MLSSSGVVLKTGLGLKKGLETAFEGPRSHLGLEGICTRSCLRIRRDSLGILDSGWFKTKPTVQ